MNWNFQPLLPAAANSEIEFVPSWWDTNYYKRRKIEFGTSHSALSAGDKVQFQIFTGYEQLVAENGINNESTGGLPCIAYYNNCTYITWMAYSDTPGANSRIYIRKYNQSTSTWSDAVDVADSATYFDSHRTASILIDNAGYIHLFYGCHNSPMKYRKSSFAEDINSWGTEQIIGSGYALTYPHPVLALNGDLYVFCRQHFNNKGYGVYLKSTDGGSSWSVSPQVVIDYSNNYGGQSSVYLADVRIDSNGRCHIFFTFWDYYGEANLGRAVAYIYSDDYSNWYNINDSWVGTTNTAPIDYTANCKVAISPNFPSAGPYYGEGTITLDDFDRPYLLYYSWTTSIQEQAKIYFAKWSGSSWSIIELTGLPGSPLMMNRRFTRIMYIDHQGNVYVYGEVLPNTTEEYFGAELYMWRGTNYGENWTHYYITKNTAWGAGVLSGLPKIYEGKYREIVYCRGKSVFYLQDINYPYIRSDGDDVRIVLHRYGQADIEIDRLPDRFNAEDSQIYFAINANAEVPENASQPDAYKSYYVYYSYYNASNPPRNVSNVFTLYENFESYNSGSDLNSQGGWSGDSGIFKVCNYADTATYSDAHTAKLYGGAKFVVVNAPGGAKSISKNIDLNNHFITIYIWTDLSSAGDLFYLELYDSSSAKYFRAGIKYNIFSYMKSGGSWTDTAKGAATNNMHEIKVLINSSGLSFWGDGGAALLSNDNHMTSCTTIKLGVDSTNGKVLFDGIKVHPYIEIEPSLTLGSVEGEDNPGTTRLAQRMNPHYVMTTRLAQRMNPHYVMTTREANKLILEVKKFLRIAEWLVTDKILTARAAHTFGLDKNQITRLSETLGLDKISVIRLMNIIIADKTDIQRCAHDTSTQYARTIRIIHSLMVDKIMTARLAHLSPTAIIGLERISNILLVDKAAIQRLSHDIIPNKYLEQRVAQYLATEKNMSARLAGALNLSSEETIRLAERILTDKELIIRLAHDAEPDKTFIMRLAETIPLEAAARQRLASWCALEAESFLRIAEHLSLDKTTAARIAQGAFFPGVETIRFSHLIAGDKVINYRLPETIPLDKIILLRMAMSASADKTLIARISNYLAFQATGTTRMAERIVPNKTLISRITNALTLWYVRTIRLAMIAAPNKFFLNRLGMKVPIYYRDLFGFHITKQEATTLALIGASIQKIALRNQSIQKIALRNQSIKI